HADAVLTLLDTPFAPRYINEIYGDTLLVVPYVMPGFALAKHCAQQLATELKPHHQGLILLNHGIFTWDNDARVSYERMIQFVDMAAQYVARHTRFKTVAPQTPVPARLARAQLRHAVSQAAGTPMLLVPRNDEVIQAFVQRADLATLTQRGCVAPDHLIRTRQIPLVGRDVAAYGARYQQWFTAHQATVAGDLTMLDPAPRIILDPELGMLTVGRRVREALIAGDVYRQSIPVMVAAEQLGGYTPLGDADLFDIEYWELEQVKLTLLGRPPRFSGQVALVTGAASGIGKACVDALVAQGAAVIALDINPNLPNVFTSPDVCSIVCDIGDEQAIKAAIDRGVIAFGGIDMVVLNAGIFPKSSPISTHDSQE
ncbi:MAG: SDR family NAD(P)-dependent oxidoreductase, partial [Roseiflexaceae bacterium]